MSEPTKLLPCPFCGGEASKRLFYKGKYRVHCNVCDAHSGDVCDTEAEAIAAWNTRHVETCELSVCGWDNDTIQCMECGAYWEHQQFDSPDYCPVNYCPSCGAKIVQGVDNAD